MTLLDDYNYRYYIICKAWGCPGFDGIGKACTASEGEGPLN